MAEPPSTALPENGSKIPRICKLDALTVRRIAAGEIIVQPANALKELLENAIDAQATMIDVLVRDGGLKLLQVTDNGHGIACTDMRLLCERFTTSKLRTFDDLAGIATYGFRGEALASILHISRLAVVSKVPGALLAYKCHYVNGKPASARFRPDTDARPQPVAGVTGTQITVEDLFYTLPLRLRALRSKNDEWTRILDVLGRYAVHTAGIGFSCKRLGDVFPTIATRPHALLAERIRTVFGANVAADLAEFSVDGDAHGLKHVRGAVSGGNFAIKRRIPMVFFINNRLVACDPLKRAVAAVFQVFLPKGYYPFVYLSLDIAPANVDVNVHPTKREVRFLHEDEIVQWVCDKVHDVLTERGHSRTYAQGMLKRLGAAAAEDELLAPAKRTRQENRMVRVDGNQQKISAFLRADIVPLCLDLRADSADSTFLLEEKAAEADSENPPQTPNTKNAHPPDTTASGRSLHDVQLDSVLELRQDVADRIHRPLTNIFNQHVYIGIVDGHKRLCCMQYDVNLYLYDYGAVLAEFYYQAVLAGFANFGELVLPEQIPLRSLLQPLYDAHADLQPMDTVVDTVMAMHDMFREYFQLDFRNEQLHMLPMVLRGVQPLREKLPHFVYRLATRVYYSDEQTCLRDVARQIALLYVPDRISEGSTESERQQALQQRDELNGVLENAVFPVMKLDFVAPECLVDAVVQVADLPGLYRVFERC